MTNEILSAVANAIANVNGNFSIEEENEFFTIKAEGSLDIYSEYDDENDYTSVNSIDLSFDSIVVECYDEDGNRTSVEDLDSESVEYIEEEVYRLCA